MPIDAHAYVFDLDDTLYLERQYVASGFAAVADRFADILGPSDATRSRMAELFDSPDRDRVFDLLAAAQLRTDPARLVGRMIETYRNHTPAITLLPDARAALDRLRSKYKLGLITDGRAAAQHAKIAALDLVARFDHIIVTDDWGREFWKPCDRAYREMSDRLRVPPERCVFVADNPAKDFLAPNRLGWSTIQITRPAAIHSPDPPTDEHRPHRRITSLDELP